MGIVVAVLLAGAPTILPTAQEHVFQVVELPAAEPPPPPAAEPPPPEPVAEVAPEPEPLPPPEPEAVAELPPPPEPPKPEPQKAEPPKPKPKAVAKSVPPRPATPAPAAAPVTQAALPVAPPAPVQEYVPPDVTAAYRHNPPPSYPLAARKRGIEGVVVLAVELGEDGRPRHVGVKRSSGFSQLDEAAESAVTSWRFTPATRGGRPVGATVEVPVRFSLEGRG